MPTKSELRQIVRDNLDDISSKINRALGGKNLKPLEPVLKRIGRGGMIPHWYTALRKSGTLPNLDGKTIGSVVEMILVAILETSTFASLEVPPLHLNPARGVDIPDIDLGIKSPSENFCTSEPFFSAYERLLGNEHDLLVLLTDYQSAKKKPPLRLQIIKWRYLANSQVADESLCRLARNNREWLIDENETWAKKLFRFLAFVNQSDWRAKRLLKMIDVLKDEEKVTEIIAESGKDFEKKNAENLRRDRTLIVQSDLDSIERISKHKPYYLGVVDAADNWVIEFQKDAGRMPNDNEWKRLLKSPLDGQIGMSLALQWRYNFGRLFGEDDSSDENAR